MENVIITLLLLCSPILKITNDSTRGVIDSEGMAMPARIPPSLKVDLVIYIKDRVNSTH
jgi:hypothetical protein